MRKSNGISSDEENKKYTEDFIKHIQELHLSFSMSAIYLVATAFFFLFVSFLFGNVKRMRVCARVQCKEHIFLWLGWRFVCMQRVSCQFKLIFFRSFFDISHWNFFVQP